MTARVVVKTKPIESPVEISVEEYMDSQDKVINNNHEINNKISDITRTMEIVESLEELAVVADSITDASREEAQLIEIGGNIAVAGTNVNPETIIPSMESFIGGKISLEEFSFREKLKKIWDYIVKTTKAIVAKIKEFIKDSNVMIAYSVNNVNKLEKLVIEAKDKKPKDTAFELDTSRFDDILNDNIDAVNSANAISYMVKNYSTFFEKFTEDYSKNLLSIISTISSKVSNIKDNKYSLRDVSLEIYDILKTAQPDLFNILTKNIDKTIHTTSVNDNGVQRTFVQTSFIGGLNFDFTQPDYSAVGDDLVALNERMRKTSIKSVGKLEGKGFSNYNSSKVLREVYTHKEMTEITTILKYMMSDVKRFRSSGYEKRLLDAKESLSKVIGDKIISLNELDSEGQQSARALMDLDLVITNMIAYPTKDIIAHTLRLERVITWLVKKNLAHYEDKKSKGNDRS